MLNANIIKFLQYNYEYERRAMSREQITKKTPQNAFLLAVAKYRMRNHERNEDITRELGLKARRSNLHITSDVSHPCVLF
jgi:hypothetical protein